MLRGMARAICLPPAAAAAASSDEHSLERNGREIADSFAAAATAAPDRRYYWSQPCRLSL